MISLTEDTYQELKKLGAAGDSFDKVISAVILQRRRKLN
jgi:predicted CopG family antitoxin